MRCKETYISGTNFHFFQCDGFSQHSNEILHREEYDFSDLFIIEYGETFLNKFTLFIFRCIFRSLKGMRF